MEHNVNPINRLLILQGIYQECFNHKEDKDEYIKLKQQINEEHNIVERLKAEIKILRGTPDYAKFNTVTILRTLQSILDSASPNSKSVVGK